MKNAFKKILAWLSHPIFTWDRHKKTIGDCACFFCCYKFVRLHWGLFNLDFLQGKKPSGETVKILNLFLVSVEWGNVIAVAEEENGCLFI